MPFTDEFNIDISKIRLAHEYVLNSVQKCEYPRGRGVYGLIYALEGSAEYRFSNGDRLTVSVGDVLFLSPACAYTIVTECAFRHYTVNFDVHAETSRFGALDQDYRLMKEKSSEHIERGFKRLVSEWRGRKAGYEMRSLACLYELLSLFYFDISEGDNNERLLPAREYIEQHFDREITLDRLAFLADMSVTNFRREWKKRYAETPIGYRDSVRLYYAKEYLACGYYTVSEIAEKCGFDDVSYFVRFFKKQIGITPGEFKKRFLGK